jgi:signal transduction histidine kinase
LSGKFFASFPGNRAGIIALAAIYIGYMAVVIRTLARPDIQSRLPAYLVTELVCLVLFTLMLWHPISRLIGQNLYFAFQTMLVLFLLLLLPQFDFIAVLFVPLSFEAALVFPRPLRWWWVTVLILLIVLTLTVTQGISGLALSLTPLTACVLFPAYVSVNQEIENGLKTSQALLDELQAANHQLTAYAAQAEELSIIQEHNRVARQLHDSVTERINNIIQLNQAAHLMLESDPGHLDSQLEHLQSLAQNSLEQMRNLIASLRPPDGATAERPTT